jgi:hypothetical protein
MLKTHPWQSTRLFLRNEEPPFSRDFPASSEQPGGTCSVTEGERKRLGYVNRLPCASSAVSNDMYSHIHGMVCPASTILSVRVASLSNVTE